MIVRLKLPKACIYSVLAAQRGSHSDLVRVHTGYTYVYRGLNRDMLTPPKLPLETLGAILTRDNAIKEQYCKLSDIT